ncbi:17912_t:CDS:2 [Gigaspora margarita]|uniref:17912_t:CDS:1 n=1 Tax=Gigaspora margarita TaxID=4874 RepID=A0ABM8W0N8_GIGMA|nr:17912_t:CDS:2 [Gigaspora margarita]
MVGINYKYRYSFIYVKRSTIYVGIRPQFLVRNVFDQWNVFLHPDISGSNFKFQELQITFSKINRNK